MNICPCFSLPRRRGSLTYSTLSFTSDNLRLLNSMGGGLVWLHWSCHAKTSLKTDFVEKKTFSLSVSKTSDHFTQLPQVASTLQ